MLVLVYAKVLAPADAKGVAGRALEIAIPRVPISVRQDVPVIAVAGVLDVTAVPLGARVPVRLRADQGAALAVDLTAQADALVADPGVQQHVLDVVITVLEIACNHAPGAVQAVAERVITGVGQAVGRATADARLTALDLAVQVVVVVLALPGVQGVMAVLEPVGIPVAKGVLLVLETVMLLAKERLVVAVAPALVA